MAHPLEFVDNSLDNAEWYCEMCGGTVDHTGETLSPVVNERPTDAVGPVIRYLAEIWLQDQRCLQLVMCRVLFPMMPYRSIASLTGYKKTTVGKLVNNMVAMRPELESLLLPNNKKARALRERAKSKGEQ